MSNLGWYQILTTMAKKVGGPKRLIGLLIGAGTLIGGGTVAGINKLKEIISSDINEKKQDEEATIVYTVSIEGKSNEELLFKVGDTFRVLAADGDAGLIERLGDENNPYVVSLKFLESISDYRIPAMRGK